MSSAHRSRSEVMWVENRMAQPSDFTMWRKMCVSSSLDTGSRPEVGSSRMSRPAWWDRASASRYFTFMPFESSLNFLLSSSAKRRRYVRYRSSSQSA